MNTHLTPQRERSFLIAMLVVYVALSIGFSLGPIFEGWDEPGHYRYTTEMIKVRGMPDPFTKPAGEFQQAPFYYFVMIPPTLLVGMPDVTQRESQQNPFYGYAWNVASADNKNLFIHPSIEVFPWAADPVALRFHLLRLTSVLLNLGTVLIAWEIFRRIWPDHPERRLAALGVVAFTPVFVSLSGLLNNDNLAIFLATLALYLLLIKPAEGFTWRWAIGLGLTLGAGILTKTSLFFLGIPVAIVLLLDRRAWKAIPVILLIVLAVAGWYYGRNLIVYHDITGIAIFAKLFPDWFTPPDQITVGVVLGRLVYMYETYWAHFGYNVIGADWPVETFFNIISLLTLISLPVLASRLRRTLRANTLTPEQKRQTLIVASFGLAMIALVAYGLVQSYSLAQGRYPLPAIVALAAAIVLSIEIWLPQKAARVAFLALPPLMAVVVAVCLFGYYFPAFDLRPLPSEIPQPLALRYGDTAELVGVDTTQLSGKPGGVARLTLYWRALKPASSRLHVLIDSQGSPAVHRESYPGAGKLYATDWAPGQGWSETYVIQLPGDAQPGSYPVTVNLQSPDDQSLLPVTGPQGTPAGPLIGQVTISP